MLIKLEIIKPLKPINSGRIIRRIFLIIAPTTAISASKLLGTGKLNIKAPPFLTLYMITQPKRKINRRNEIYLLNFFPSIEKTVGLCYHM